MSLLNKELWLPAIASKLYQSYDLLKTMGTDDTSNILSGQGVYRVVHIASAGDFTSAVTVNDATLLKTAQKRNDFHLSYPIDKFELGPIVITNEEAKSVSYEKQQDVTSHMTSAIDASMGYKILQSWANLTNVIETSGATRKASFGTGNRKSFTVNDLLAAKEKLDNQDFPETDRYVALTSSMANDLLADLKSANNQNIVFVEKDNMLILNQLFYGFKIISFSTVVNAEVVGGAIELLDYKEQAAVPANGIQLSIAFHKSAVSLGMAEPDMFSSENDPHLRGNAITLQAFAGASPRYASADNVASGKGIVVIAQDIV